MKTLPILYRTFPASDVLVETRADGEGNPTTYTFSISSEAPVERWFGKEILSHEDNALDKTYMRSGLSILADSHWGQQVGILENTRVENKKIRGDGRFSKGAYGQEVEQDVKDKIRKYVSVGYRVLKAKLIETKDGVDTWLITRWMPIHMAILADPADVSVGYGRAEGQQEYEVEIEDGDPVQEERTMVPNDGTPTPAPAATGARAASDPPPAPAPAAPVVETQSRRNYSQEAAEIFRLAHKHGVPNERAAEWVEKGLTPLEVGREILNGMRTEGSAQPPAEELPGSEKDMRNYSYTRAIRLGLALRGERGVGDFDGLEAEVHQELLRKAPNAYSHRGGILIPMRTQKSGRALDTKTPGAGAELVQDGAGELIEMLRTRTMVMAMGATVLPGLTRPIPFPKQTSGMTMHFVSENPGSDVPDSTPGTGLAILGPKNLMGQGKFSRQLVIEASVDSEQMIRREIVNADGRAFDQAALHGTGTAGEPEGVYNAADVNPKPMGGVPDFGKLVDMLGLVADKDADMGSLGFMTTPLMATKMMQTLVASAAGSSMIWTGTIQDGRMAGYRATATNQVKKTLGAGAEHGLVFGNWSDVVIGFWDALELLLDPYTLAGQAMLRIIAFHMGDVLIRHGQSFTKATGATIGG